MIEDTIINYITLEERESPTLAEIMGFDGGTIVPVYATRPVDAPEYYFMIERTGGSESNMLHTTTLAVQSYGPTLLEAAKLNKWVIEHMKQIAKYDDVASSKYQTDYNFTNTLTKQPRYQAVFSILHYE